MAPAARRAESHCACLLQQDEVYRKKYNELLQLNSEFAAMELDEPSMAFSYNVMETIRTEHAKQPLKAAVDKRIILGIASFFVLTLSVLLHLYVQFGELVVGQWCSNS
jgi:hypothetical protein